MIHFWKQAPKDQREPPMLTCKQTPERSEQGCDARAVAGLIGRAWPPLCWNTGSVTRPCHQQTWRDGTISGPVCLSFAKANWMHGFIVERQDCSFMFLIRQDYSPKCIGIEVLFS